MVWALVRSFVRLDWLFSVPVGTLGPRFSVFFFPSRSSRWRRCVGSAWAGGRAGRRLVGRASSRHIHPYRPANLGICHAYSLPSGLATLPRYPPYETGSSSSCKERQTGDAVLAASLPTTASSCAETPRIPMDGAACLLSVRAACNLHPMPPLCERAHTRPGLECRWVEAPRVSCLLSFACRLVVVVRHSQPRSSSRTLLSNHPPAATHSTFFALPPCT